MFWSIAGAAPVSPILSSNSSVFNNKAINQQQSYGTDRVSQ
jgi:hypothetical protein